MARNRYLTMKDSDVTNDLGIAYPDVLTMPIEKFEFTEEPYELTLLETDIDRIDLLMYKYYGVAYYDDVVLWVNDIASIHDLSPGDILLLPIKKDLETFFIKYSR